jgi:hypothetical protein
MVVRLSQRLQFRVEGQDTELCGTYRAATATECASWASVCRPQSVSGIRT